MNWDAVHTCAECGKRFKRAEMTWSYDCQGIPFRLLCYECWDKILDRKGYDGELYTALDECLDDDY